MSSQSRCKHTRGCRPVLEGTARARKRRRFTLSQRNRMGRQGVRLRRPTGWYAWLRWLWAKPVPMPKADRSALGCIAAFLLPAAICLLLLAGCASGTTYRRTHTETIMVDGMMIVDTWEAESHGEPTPEAPE